MSAHTAGPWQVLQPQQIHKSDEWQGMMILDGPRQTLAEVFSVDHGDAQANASLIAAAPELLAAIESFVDRKGPINIDAMRALIAKARGQA